jgi:hypothetical protein
MIWAQPAGRVAATAHWVAGVEPPLAASEFCVEGTISRHRRRYHGPPAMARHNIAPAHAQHHGESGFPTKIPGDDATRCPAPLHRRRLNDLRRWPRSHRIFGGLVTVSGYRSRDSTHPRDHHSRRRNAHPHSQSKRRSPAGVNHDRKYRLRRQRLARATSNHGQPPCGPGAARRLTMI